MRSSGRYRRSRPAAASAGRARRVGRQLRGCMAPGPKQIPMRPWAVARLRSDSYPRLPALGIHCPSSCRIDCLCPARRRTPEQMARLVVRQQRAGRGADARQQDLSRFYSFWCNGARAPRVLAGSEVTGGRETATSREDWRISRAQLRSPAPAASLSLSLARLPALALTTSVP